MRDYGCSVHFYNGSEFFGANRDACFSMVYDKIDHDIYIAGFDDPLTRKYQRRLCWIINQVTPCYIITVTPEQPRPPDAPTPSLVQRMMNLVVSAAIPEDKKQPVIQPTRYIKFHMLNGYDKSLILLNFIRNLWYQPVDGYTERFFQALKVSRAKYKDPVSRLTWANKEALSGLPVFYYYYGHSNVHEPQKLKVKTTKELLALYNGCGTATFLTT